MTGSGTSGGSLRRVAAVAAAALLAGCTLLQAPRTQRENVYLLSALPAANPHPRADGELVLAVSAPRAQPGFAGERMVYVRRPYELEAFAHNRWADPPARMLAPLLVQALRQAGGFRAVVQASSGVAADLRLDTELVRLQQDFSTQPSRIELTLRAQLLDLRQDRLLAAREFDVSEPSPQDDPYGGVVAANRAVARVLGQLSAFCSAAARRP